MLPYLKVSVLPVTLGMKALAPKPRLNGKLPLDERASIPSNKKPSQNCHMRYLEQPFLRNVLSKDSFRFPTPLNRKLKARSSPGLVAVELANTTVALGFFKRVQVLTDASGILSRRCHSCNRADVVEWRSPDGSGTLCNLCGLRAFSSFRSPDVSDNQTDYAKLTRKLPKGIMQTCLEKPQSSWLRQTT